MAPLFEVGFILNNHNYQIYVKTVAVTRVKYAMIFMHSSKLIGSFAARMRNKGVLINNSERNEGVLARNSARDKRVLVSSSARNEETVITLITSTTSKKNEILIHFSNLHAHINQTI